MGYFSTAEKRGVHPAYLESWLIRGATGPESASGVVVDQETALSSSAILQGVRLVSETVGRVPLGIYQRKDPGRELLRDHPAHKVLNHPNDEITAVELRSMVQSFAITAGVGYAEIVFDGGGRGAELWPIPPHRVRPERSEMGTLRFRVRADDGSERLVPQENMLVIPGFQRGGLLGVDIVARMQESIGLTLATEKFGAAFFGNGSIVSGFVRKPGLFTDSQKQNLRESFERVHRGPSKAHRIGLLEEGMEWVASGVPPDAAQFLETRKFQVDEAARILNVPPHLLWHLERATFNNIEELGIAFVVYSLQSWWVRWEQRIAARLLLPSEREAGLYAKHNANELLRGSPEKRAAYVREMFGIGALSQNDARELDDLNPIEGGDRYYVQSAMVPIDKIDEWIASKKTAPAPAPAPRSDWARAAHEKLFRSTAEAIVKSEVERVRGALRKSFGGRDGVKLREALDEIYADHAARVESRLSPVPDGFSEAWVARSLDELRAAMQAEDVEFAVETVLRTWEKARAEQEADRALDDIEKAIKEVA